MNRTDLIALLSGLRPSLRVFGSFPTLAKKRHEESELDRSEGERSKPEEGKITHARSCFGARKKKMHTRRVFCGGVANFLSKKRFGVCSPGYGRSWTDQAKAPPLGQRWASTGDKWCAERESEMFGGRFGGFRIIHKVFGRLQVQTALHCRALINGAGGVALAEAQTAFMCKCN